MIATANGISFATKIPLVGVDGLTSLLHEYTDQIEFHNHCFTKRV